MSVSFSRNEFEVFCGLENVMYEFKFGLDGHGSILSFSNFEKYLRKN